LSSELHVERALHFLWLYNSTCAIQLFIYKKSAISLIPFDKNNSIHYNGASIFINVDKLCYCISIKVWLIIMHFKSSFLLDVS
jgi:hypothetical protein